VQVKAAARGFSLIFLVLQREYGNMFYKLVQNLYGIDTGGFILFYVILQGDEGGGQLLFHAPPPPPSSSYLHSYIYILPFPEIGRFFLLLVQAILGDGTYTAAVQILCH
jgi:hypothetical protein